jgi:hypothetical protein
MMRPLPWAFIGLVAMLWTLVAVVGPTIVDDVEQADLLGIVAGVASVLAWGMWAYLAFSIRLQDGTIVSYPAVALFGVAMALPGGYVALTGPFELFDTDRATDAERFDT